mmetsp:Transcript_29856/g.49260  ORF Transcript_29856/g.49260 Transcript_29856/m.49260 type:complete len:178 (+) Transcript_29856:62-595(+)|eukprot:CAMPEP_0119010654 /NCGR_PEP_ID=MMETSP1176-20130426/5158_1 /TAXON_ID=265551 /ORGANISM="Synedropsis recta cf, Strain CCMP1620" /LENGTH=177 /DNA_ID=CAMNT_0006963357 /DNA_START=57 /DNA_END=590 /DNA_ORIENTATION=+
MNSFLLLALATIVALMMLVQETAAFSCPRPSVVLLQRARFTSSSLAATSKEDEIAELEQKLRQLKEEKEVPAVAAADDDDDDDEAPVNASNQLLEEPMLEMLSESWKETDASQSGDGGGGGIILKVVGAVLALVFLVGFSQVPVGQTDLSKYSVGKSSNQIDLGDLNEARKKATEGL